MEEKISATVSLFSVKVPVLSEQSTSMLPKSSMAERRLTTTLFFARRKAPRDKEKVVTTGSASGMTLTAKAIENIKSSPILTPSPLIKRFAKNIKNRVERTSQRINLLKLLMLFSKTLSLAVAAAKWAMPPIWVSAPAAKTIPSPLPLRATVPAKPIFFA
ncbi:MAG: hypothetical protein UX56_C0014G0017 [Candidatus Azambacteria bacterium GW2011_GWD2_46_48]|uniref:Uncharacterized protein n=1 Tax=Candidatus Azambacteria bacterium GW2011_GWD2_46_48 TaxID=1618623 RepID=A0A0G1T953_9BACT|nr:MAG: hypothetical protein UX56_C0014G0017 [Candidatus Azambacteria bacterium GW2011_GWD2_46_48]